MLLPYTVQFILTEAIFESLQDREFEPVIRGEYQAVALNKLTGLFDEWRDKIPFAQEITFDNVQALQNTTFVSVNNVNYILPPTTLAKLRCCTGRDEFYRLSSVIGLNSLPAVYYFDDLSQTIDVYPIPTAPTYQFVVWGRPQLLALNPTDTLPPNITRFMTDALIYELAKRLCATYGNPWDAAQEQILQGLMRLLTSNKIMDLRPNKQRVFSRPGRKIPGYPYAYHLFTGQ